METTKTYKQTVKDFRYECQVGDKAMRINAFAKNPVNGKVGKDVAVVMKSLGKYARNEPIETSYLSKIIGMDETKLGNYLTVLSFLGASIKTADDKWLAGNTQKAFVEYRKMRYQ